MISFDLFVSYAQIAVFEGMLARPFNDWTDQHVKQGFSWRAGSVSFKTLVESGMVKVEFARVLQFSASSGTLRSIAVPFSHSGHEIEIATITESRALKLEPGNYDLVFETGWDEKVCWGRFSAIPSENQGPRILVRDAEIDPVFPLLMSAEPA